MVPVQSLEQQVAAEAALPQVMVVGAAAVAVGAAAVAVGAAVVAAVAAVAAVLCFAGAVDFLAS